MKNKFKKGDIAYSVNIDDSLVVKVTKLIVDDFFFNSLPDINKYIYSCIGLEDVVVIDYKITEETTSTTTVSGSYSELSLCFKHELNDKIKESVDERIQQNERIKIAAEQFRCPITGGILKREEWNRYTLDGPTKYLVEGFNIIWIKYSRDWEFDVYHTKYHGTDYSFIYLGQGEWKEVIEIKGNNGGGIYVDKKLYISSDETVLNQVSEFLRLQDEAYQKWENNITVSTIQFPKIKPVHAMTINQELVTVSPMSMPTGIFSIFEPLKKEKVVIVIENEGQYEIDIDRFKNWNYKEIGENKFEFGDTKFSIEK